MFKNSRGIGAGGISILMVFVILCIVIFSALSLVSAQADLKLSLNNRTGVESFYKADAAASSTMAKIDEAIVISRGVAAGSVGLDKAAELSGIVLTSGDPLNPEKVFLGILKKLSVFVSVNKSGQRAVMFTIPIDTARKLYVSLALSAGGGKNYTVEAYQIISDADWKIETEIKVWQGN